MSPKPDKQQADWEQALAAMSIGIGMPVIYPSTNACRRLPGLGSASRLRRADVLALLAGK